MKYFHRKGQEQVNQIIKNSLFFPSCIIKGHGVSDLVSDLIKDKKNIAILADKFVMKNFSSLIQIQKKNHIKLNFNGECSSKEFFRLKQIILKNKADCLIGLGGGKAMDISKLLKRDVKNLLLILVPTSAATCAATTQVSVVYSEEGIYEDTVDSVCADYIVIDYNIFSKLPLVFFSAGFADIIAKYFEIKAAAKFINADGRDIYDYFVYNLSEKIYLKLREITYNWDNMDKKIIEELTDMNIIFSGVLSLLGRFNVTTSGAHLIAHSLTLMNKSQFLHGEYVAMGLIIQENILKNKKNVKELKDLFIIHDLPYKLSKLNIKRDDIKNIFDFYCKIKNREKIIFPVKDELVYNELIKNT